MIVFVVRFLFLVFIEFSLLQINARGFYLLKYTET